MKKIISMFCAVALTATAAAAQGGSLDNFTSRNKARAFIDVTNTAWYFEAVSKSSELGIIEGTGKGRFSPDGTLTVAEAVTLAAKTNAIYYGRELPKQEEGSHWASAILDYAGEHNITVDYSEDDLDALITRGEMMKLFYNSLAEGAGECADFAAINDLSLLRDSSGDKYANALFAAGVVSGDENGRFNLGDTIRRCEAASIILRVARTECRVKAEPPFEKLLPDKNNLFILPDRVMEAYYADKNARQRYADMLNLYAERVPMSVNMKAMLVPTQISFADKAYRDSCDSQKETIDYIYSNMSDRILPLDVYSRLEAHAGEYIYFKTDHHWTQLGAYYGYQSMFGDYAIPLSEFTKHNSGSFTGWLYGQAGSPSLSNGYDSLDWYILGENYPVHASDIVNGQLVYYTPHVFHTSIEPSYLLFMGGDAPFATVTSGNKNGATLLVMKDSYGDAVLPYLINHYETTIIVDPRTCYKSMNEIFDRYSINDFVIINYVPATNFNDFIDKQISLWK